MSGSETVQRARRATPNDLVIIFYWFRKQECCFVKRTILVYKSSDFTGYSGYSLRSTNKQNRVKFHMCFFFYIDKTNDFYFFKKNCVLRFDFWTNGRFFLSFLFNTKGNDYPVTPSRYNNITATNEIYGIFFFLTNPSWEINDGIVVAVYDPTR